MLKNSKFLFKCFFFPVRIISKNREFFKSIFSSLLLLSGYYIWFLVVSLLGHKLHSLLFKIYNLSEFSNQNCSLNPEVIGSLNLKILYCRSKKCYVLKNFQKQNKTKIMVINAQKGIR